MNCPRCKSTNTEYRGQQRGIDPRNRRWYSFPLYQCNHCGTSFGVIADKRYEDDGEPVPAKAEVMA